MGSFAREVFVGFRCSSGELVYCVSRTSAFSACNSDSGDSSFTVIVYFSRGIRFGYYSGLLRIRV